MSNTSKRYDTPDFALLLLLIGMALACPAQAAYRYTSIDYPGAPSTQVFAITDSGAIVGDAVFGPNAIIPFLYDVKSGIFTPLPTVPGGAATNAVGINQPGIIVGSVGDGTNNIGLIMNGGASTLFANPGWAFSEARGISASGLVTGYSVDASGNNTSGFIYNPADNTFVEVLPSSFTLAQGINSQLQVVGNVTLNAGVAYVGAPFGSYGFLRDSNGAIVIFAVAGGHNTRGRGINAVGLVTGFFRDPIAGTVRGFVAPVANQPAFQWLTIPSSRLLDAPNAVATNPEAIDDTGRVVGIWTDSEGGEHGFVAIPIPGTF